MKLLNASRADVVRFMKHVVVLPNGCWLWMGSRSRGQGNRAWYGTFYFKDAETGKGHRVRAHRFSSEVLKKQACPPGYHRDHECETSLCVCPNCIEVITHEENQKRKVERRRNRATEADALARALEMYDG